MLVQCTGTTWQTLRRDLEDNREGSNEQDEFRKNWSRVGNAAQPFFQAMGYRVVKVQTVFWRCVELRNRLMQKTLTAGA